MGPSVGHQCCKRTVEVKAGGDQSRASLSFLPEERAGLEPVSVAVVMIGWRPFSLAALRSQLLAWFQRDCFSVGNGLLNVLHTVSLLCVLCISIYPILCLLPFCYPWYGLGIAQ